MAKYLKRNIEINRIWYTFNRFFEIYRSELWMKFVRPTSSSRRSRVSRLGNIFTNFHVNYSLRRELPQHFVLYPLILISILSYSSSPERNFFSPLVFHEIQESLFAESLNIIQGKSREIKSGWIYTILEDTLLCACFNEWS